MEEFLWVIGFILVITLIGDWITHISMTREHNGTWGWGNYRKFRQYFWRYKWDFDRDFKRSLFDRESVSELHANIISFQYRGMVINNPISLWMVKFFIWKYIRANFRKELDSIRRNTVKW